MGGGQANKQQATAANANASAQANQSAALAQKASANAAQLQPQADQYGAERQQLYSTLWGAPTAGAPAAGALGGFLDPSKLNVSSPTGPYAQMYTRANEQTAKDTENALASTRREAANRGFAGSGMADDAALKTRLAAADQRGQNFGTATNASYQDALSNFWNAVQAAQADKGTSQQGQLNTEQLQHQDQGQAIGAQSNAAQTYSQLYGTAGAYHPSAAGNVVGSAIGAGGAVGAAAMCICEGTQILMDDERLRMIQDVKPKDHIRSRDGRFDEVLDVEVIPDVPCYLVATGHRNFMRASGTHTIERPGGGYILVRDCMGATISTKDGADRVQELSGIGKRTVYKLKLRYYHIYLSNGIWSLE